MEVDRDARFQDGRVYLKFESGSQGSTARGSLYSHRLDDRGYPHVVGTGINVSALGTITADDARAFAKFLIEEAQAIDREKAAELGHAITVDVSIRGRALVRIFCPVCSCGWRGKDGDEVAAAAQGRRHERGAAKS